jgi:AraC-like DNA-binding protein
MQMADKSYAEYSQKLLIEYRNLPAADTVVGRKIILQVEETAKKTGSMEWTLLAEYLELMLFEKKMELCGTELFPVDEFHRIEVELLDRTQKTKTLPIELLVRWKMIDFYFNKVNNYELAFEQCAIQDKKLQTVTSENFPDKAHFYLQIANNYFLFKDFPTAIFYFKKILEEKETAINQFSQQNARNGIGLSYLQTNQPDSAEYYFLAMKQVIYLNDKNESYHDIFDAMADGNTGAVMLSRNEYDKAIPFFESSFAKALKSNDNSFAGARAADIANIYLKKENLQETKRYIDLAITYRNKTRSPRSNDFFYEVLSKYYAATGDTKQSIIYMDMMLTEKKKIEEQFNTTLLLRMEQQELMLHQREFEQESAKRQQAQRLLIVLGVGLIIICCLSGYMLILYRRKRKAYRELVRKSQEWAQVSTEIVEQVSMHDLVEDNDTDNCEKPNKLPDETDFSIMKVIEKLMSDEKLYTDISLTLDILALRLGAKRRFVSNAINNCTTKSFNAFINEYRLKEAIRLLSKKDFNLLSIDQISFNAGFGDRHNFYRVFKKTTGLSPTEFRKNVNV